MDNLLIRNQVRRSLIVEGGKVFPEIAQIRLTQLSVRLTQGTVFVQGEFVGPPSLVTQKRVNDLRDRISEIVATPVVLKFGIIPETVVCSTE